MKKKKKKRLQRIARRKENRAQQRGKREILTGVISIGNGNYGFVKVAPQEDGTPVENDLFVPPRFLCGAMSGDTVKVEILPDRPKFSENDETTDRGRVAKVIEILKHARDTIVAEVVNRHEARPLNRKIRDNIFLSNGPQGAQRGDWVELKLLHDKTDGEDHYGKVIRKIGEAGVIQSDLDAVMAEFDLMPPYTDEENREAAALPIREITREDLRSSFAVTIDPVDAKDYDDAVGIVEIPDAPSYELTVAVHISDVAGRITPDSKFDKKAFKRSFTSYLPGRTLPMLPKDLTKAISLTAGQDNFAHTVLLVVDVRNGKILRARRCHSIVHIAKRLDYETVQLFIDTGVAPEDWTEQEKTNIQTLVDVSRKVRASRRKQEEFLTMEIPEIRVLCDEGENKILGISRKVQRESEQLIEEFMLAANSAIAAELVNRSIPGLFRVHPEPDPEKLSEFVDLAANTFGLPIGDLSNRKECNEFLDSLPNDPRRPIVLNAFLRSMARANYQAKPSLHFGLGKLLYSHFTSPIRRYPDLLVHQQLWAFDLNQRLRSKALCEKFGLECSAKEENNDNAYYSANDRLKLRYLDEHLGKDRDLVYTGVIARLLNHGFQVDIEELGVYGFVPIESLPGHCEKVDKEIRSPHGKHVYKVGDLILLTLKDVDFSRGNAVFAPATPDQIAKAPRAQIMTEN